MLNFRLTEKLHLYYRFELLLIAKSMKPYAQQHGNLRINKVVFTGNSMTKPNDLRFQELLTQKTAKIFILKKSSNKPLNSVENIKCWKANEKVKLLRVTARWVMMERRWLLGWKEIKNEKLKMKN